MVRYGLFLSLGLLMIAGCQPSAANQAAPGAAPAQPQPAAGSAKSDEVKTPIIRALLDVLDNIELEEDNGAKDQLRQILVDSDEDLSKMLGDNRVRLIKEANKKPAPLVIGGGTCAKRPQPPKKKPESESQSDEAAEPPSDPAADSADSGEPKAGAPSEIVQSLLEKLDEMDTGDEATKAHLREALLQSDRELHPAAKDGA